MYTLYLKLVTVICFMTPLRCARILAIFPSPAISHQIVFRPITQELSRRGHEVVVITPNPAFSGQRAPDNLIEIDVSNVSYAIWDRVVFKDTTAKSRDTVADNKNLTKFLYRIFEAAMQTEQVRDIIEKREHYDLLLTEQMMELSLGFSHVFKAPVIQISSLGNLFFDDDSIGSEKHPLVYPHLMSQRVYNLTKFEKIQAIWSGLKFMSAYYESMKEEMNEIIKRIFGPETPPLRELKNNIHMTMLNVHHMWIDNQPLSPNVILIGGVHEKPPIPLPQDLQERLDSSKNGTIYVSFGSKIALSNFAPETIRILFEVLCNLPFDVLLKWDEAKLPIECRNIKFLDWFPQADVLRHPNVKLFIMQGGLQSTDEAISGGVPLIGIPIMGDQYYNSEKYVHHGIGKLLYWDDFNAKTFRNTILEVIHDKSYYENIVRLRALMQDSPQSPLERAVWWAEYVLRHGGARHLRPPTASMTLYQYYELDLLICIFSCLSILFLVVAITIYIIVKYIKRYLSGKQKVKLF